jgi:hypothetical protein
MPGYDREYSSAMNTRRRVCLLALSALFAVAAAPQAAPAAKPKCDPNYVPTPSQAEWTPMFFVGREGIRILAPKRLDNGAYLSPETIQTLVIGLNAADWTRGCSVAVHEQGLRSGNDDEIIEGNLKVLDKALGAMGVRIAFIVSA